ncbi:MAG: hypothetical protein K0Q87_3815 [Neobacillus sp.]|jgi:hypothetical protein|nr:hypothetical protein [Neobacillus sp.]
MTIYRGLSGVNREVKQQCREVGGVNREIKEQHRGIGGFNRKVFESKKYLYYEGEERTTVTGGWLNRVYATYGDSGSYTKNTNSIYIVASTSLSRGETGICTQNRIDLTEYNTLYICVLSGYEGYYSMTRYDWAGYCVPVITNTYNSGNIWDDPVKQELNACRIIGVNVIDIASLSGSYYVSLMARPQGYCTFNKIWLE